MAGEFVAGGRSLPAGHGWAWIAAAWALFKKNPGTWIGIIVAVMLIYIVLALVPVVGHLATILLGPVFGGGIVLGARAQDEGRALEFGHLFAGFRERFGPLVLVGVLYLVASVVVALVVMLFAGASVLSLLAGGEREALPAGALLTVLVALLAIAALMIPVLMAVWFAPALVVFHGEDAVPAMKQSFLGCLRNIVPFLVYGVVLFVFGLLASIPLGLGWLLLGPVIAASLYTAYKDIFISA